MEIVLVKLGGSLITDKTQPSTELPSVLARLAQELARSPGINVVLGHGSGSFGHHAAVAQEQALLGPPGKAKALGAAAVQRAAHSLHRRVLSALDAEGLAPWSILPSSVPAAAEAETPGSAPPATRPVCERALHHGLLPVTCGDIVLTADGSIAIWSTEDVLLRLTRDLHAAGQRVTRAIWLGITDGVYDDEGQTIRSLRPRDPTDVPSSVGGSAGTDVTGGMRLRVASAFEFARLGVESWILDGRRVGVLEAALRGERQGGTQVDAATRSHGDSHGT